MALISILLLIMKELPLAVNTVRGIKELLSKDPSIPAELQTILASTEADNAAVIASAQAWLAANPS